MKRFLALFFAVIALGSSTSPAAAQPHPSKKACDLMITKSLAHMSIHAPFQTGQQVTFEFIVTNLGSTTCTAPTSVLESFSPGATYVSGGGGSGWNCLAGSPGSVTCNNSAPIAPAGISNFFISFKVTGPPPSEITDCATLTNHQDSNVGKNQACAKEPIRSPCKDATEDLSTGPGT